jgi:hypothetical protein
MTNYLRPWFSILATAAAVLPCSFANGSVVLGDPSVTAVPPTDDPGWANLTASGLNYTYLGNGWALSARHVGTTSTLQFPTGSVSLIPGQNYTVHNPATVENENSQDVNLTASNGTLETDLRLVRLKDDPGLPAVTIADQSPLANGRIVFIGNGRSRELVQTTWDGSTNPWTATSCVGSNCFRGYKAFAGETKRWGENNVADPSNYPGMNSFFEVLSPTTGVAKLTTMGEGVTRNMIAMPTQFDLSGGLPHEAQPVDEDSGTAVFYKRNDSQWELAGIVNSVLTFENQAKTWAVYNDTTNQGSVAVITDLSYYYNTNPAQDHVNSISHIMRMHPHFSTIGDINFDGNVSGTGSGPASTDDVTAFIQGFDGPGTQYMGWGYNNGTGDATYTSWKNGDIAHPFGFGACNVSLGSGLCAGGDGKTDVYDFLALRNAINNPMGLGALDAFFSGLSGGSNPGVPEPTSAALAIVATFFLAAGTRRRRQPAV